MTALVLRSKLLYSSGAVGAEALTQSRNVWLIYFYAPPADAGRDGVLALGVVSGLLFAGRLLEAFDDAVIGWWSDRTRSRWGRRIPFVVGATPLWALFGFLMFAPPAESSTAVVAAYFFLTLQMFHLFGTLSGGPYEALLPEIATTSRERVSVSAMNVYFGIGGAAIGLVGSGLMVDVFGFRAMALTMAGIALATRYIGLAGVWRQARISQPTAQIGLRDSLRETFKNVNFLIFLPSFVLFQVGLVLLTGVLPFYVSAILESDSEGIWTAILTAVAIGAMAAALPFFARLSRRTSKRHAYSTAMLASALAFPILFVPGFVPGVPLIVQVLVALAIVGAPVAGVYLFPGPLIADICDEDTARTGLRREATFYGGQNFVEKTVGSIAPLILALVLLLGNSADNPLGVRMVGPVAGIIVFAGYLIFRRFDLPDDASSSICTTDAPAYADQSSVGASRG